MKKKHDDGYVLAYVMVVITVLCLIAVSLLSISLKNMQAQTADIKRMQDKYAAQGEIEKVVAQLEAITTIPKANTEDFLNEKLGTLDEDINVSTSFVNGESGRDVKITIVSINETIQIDCVLIWKATLTETETEYIVSSSIIEYDSYQISAVAGEGGTNNEIQTN